MLLKELKVGDSFLLNDGDGNIDKCKVVEQTGDLLPGEIMCSLPDGTLCPLDADDEVELVTE